MSHTTTLILGNAVALVGSILMICIGFIRGKKKILAAQSVMFAIMALGNLILGGFTGVLTNAISIFRNLWNFKLRYTWPVKVFFILIQAIIALRVNNLGLIGWLPVIAAGAFTWFLDVKSDLELKILIATTQIPWLIYDIYILNISASIFDIMAIITNTISIVTILREQKGTTHGNGIPK